MRHSFQHLYTLSLQRNTKVSQVWSHHGWELLFRRASNDWEIGEVANLLKGLNSHPALSVRHDKPRCKLHIKGVFTVISCYWNLNTIHIELDRWLVLLVWYVERHA